jgi:hypothetical protein
MDYTYEYVKQAFEELGSNTLLTVMLGEGEIAWNPVGKTPIFGPGVVMYQLHEDGGITGWVHGESD